MKKGVNSETFSIERIKMWVQTKMPSLSRVDACLGFFLAISGNLQVSMALKNCQS
jgi:hypothetical protein